VVVLKPRLAHSYWEIHRLNERSALNKRSHCRSGSDPERGLFLSWQSASAARRQAKEGAEREGTQRNCQQGFAEDDCNCSTANRTDKGRTFERQGSGCLDTGSNAL
jgi:hypothetical protein